MADTLSDEAFDRICKYLYGDTWKLGNGDGSAYLVLGRPVVRRLDGSDPRPAKSLP